MLTAAALDAFLVALQANMTAAGFADDHDLVKFVGAARTTLAENGRLLASGPLLTLEEVAAEIQLAPDTVKKLHARGKMPKPMKMGYRTNRWRRSDIYDWIRFGCKSAKVTAAAVDAERRGMKPREIGPVSASIAEQEAWARRFMKQKHGLDF